MSGRPEDPTGPTIDVDTRAELPDVEWPETDAEDERYVLKKRLGIGGMGEVWAARDRRLQRDVAVKVLHPRLAQDRGALARFDAEARIVAQLEHPGIVPIYDHGRLGDGRAFFAMKRIVGKTLSQLRQNTPLRGRVQRLHRVAQTVAFAHQRGVVHRDLKPSNVMVGPFGEVMVLDWGIASLANAGDQEAIPDSIRGGLQTRAGSVTGSLSTMAPEQAQGRTAGPPADVFALSAMLFAILTGGMPHPRDDRLEARKRGDRVDRPQHGDPLLIDVAMGGLEPLPASRPTAQAFAASLEQWLDGTARKTRALEVVAEASERLPRAAQLTSIAQLLRRQAQSKLQRLSSDCPESERHSSWEALELAEVKERDAAIERARYVQQLQGALSIDPECARAHALLAEHWRDRHAAHESMDETLEAQAALPFLEAHDRGEHAAYLKGEGQVTLHTEPPARATLYRIQTVNRRRVPVDGREVGDTPLALTLPIGAYVLRLEADGCQSVHVPIRVRRLQHEDFVDPQGRRHVHALPPAGRRGERLVTAGWFEMGTGVPSGHVLPRSRVWCDAFVMREYPVTNGEYLEFLSAVACQDPDRAARHVPRDLEGQPVYGRAGQTYTLGLDAHGHPWEPEMPVVLVTWEDAMAYAAWRAERDGCAWRLPWELEWAKAARGVDYRIYPWGNAVEPTWARMVGSPGPPGPHAVSSFPTDVSPYGIRHLGGNAATWLLDAFPDGGRLDGHRVHRGGIPDCPSGSRHIRGGGWRYGMGTCRSDSRKAASAVSRSENVGIRLVRDDV